MKNKMITLLRDAKNLTFVFNMLYIPSFTVSALTYPYDIMFDTYKRDTRWQKKLAPCDSTLLFKDNFEVSNF